MLSVPTLSQHVITPFTQNVLGSGRVPPTSLTHLVLSRKNHQQTILGPLASIWRIIKWRIIDIWDFWMNSAEIFLIMLWLTLMGEIWGVFHELIIDRIWCHTPWSTTVERMACCLMVPSHYLNLRCWLIILKNKPACIFNGDVHDTNSYFFLKIVFLK